MKAKTVRQACRDREPLDGADAQCLEHALTQAESQLAAERERRQREGDEADALWQSKVHAALAAQKQPRSGARLEDSVRRALIHDTRVCGGTHVGSCRHMGPGEMITT